MNLAGVLVITLGMGLNSIITLAGLVDHKEFMIQNGTISQ